MCYKRFESCSLVFSPLSLAVRFTCKISVRLLYFLSVIFHFIHAVSSFCCKAAFSVFLRQCDLPDNVSYALLCLLSSVICRSFWAVLLHICFSSLAHERNGLIQISHFSTTNVQEITALKIYGAKALLQTLIKILKTLLCHLFPHTWVMANPTGGLQKFIADFTVICSRRAKKLQLSAPW